MGAQTADLKTRYSIYVPKPLARINLGAWQVREGTAQSPKFGYNGVSIQTDASMFVDVVKNTYLQLKGGFTAQTTDWFQCSQKPMVLATGDAATVASDVTVTVVAGAGQLPTWTLDHGDGPPDPYPYNNLQLHYRVEEVQNSLFEFFRGRREKNDPFDKSVMQLTAGATFKIGGELFKQEVAFTSHKPWWELTGPDKGAKEIEAEAKLRGGFELIAERSWQELFGKKDWDFTKTKQDGAKTVFDKVAPHDIFSGIKDIRLEPDTDPATSKQYLAEYGRGRPGKKAVNLALQDEVDTNSGNYTYEQLYYGFSSYFARFDPYLMINLDAIEADTKMGPMEKKFMKVIATLQNVTTLLKRNTDVLYKLYNVIKDNALMKEVQATFGAIDAINTSVKAIRTLGVDMWKQSFAPERTAFYYQFMDEGISGAGTRVTKWTRGGANFAAESTAQATVRSVSPTKDVRNASKDKGDEVGFKDKGFGLWGGKGLQQGDQIRIETDKGSFTTPPLDLGEKAATAAILAGGEVDRTAVWDPPPGATVYVQFDGQHWSSVDLSAAVTAFPEVASTLASDAVGASSTLAGKELKFKVNGGAEQTISFSAADCATSTTLATKLALIPGLTVTTSGNQITWRGSTSTPGSSVEIVGSSALAPLGLSAAIVRRPVTVGQLVDAFKAAAGARAAVTTTAGKSKITLTSTTTGATSKVRLSEEPAGSLAKLGLSSVAADGKDKVKAKKASEITADDLVALFKQSPDLNDASGSPKAEFAVEDGAVVIKSPTKGYSSSIKIHSVTGDMRAALGFVGDTANGQNEDQVRDPSWLGPGGRVLDDLDKMNTELQSLPDDIATPIRPIIALARNTMGQVSKLLGSLKSLAKFRSLKLPQAKGAVGILANKGISLGTPDRIVGAGGQGVVFIADGGTGLPDHAKYVPLEDIFNRIIGADLFARYENTKAKPSLGFRVYSDTTADLVSRNTANVLALGRSKLTNGDVVGTGVARIGASYAVEVAGREKVVLRTAKDDNSAIEVIGKTITLGLYDEADDRGRLGPRDMGGATKGWHADTKTALPETSKIFAHASDHAAIVVGDYMIQVRSKEAYAAAKADAKRALRELTRAQQAEAAAQAIAVAKKTLYTTEVALLEAARDANDAGNVAALIAGLFANNQLGDAVLAWQAKLDEWTAKHDQHAVELARIGKDLPIARQRYAGGHEADGILITVRDTDAAKKSPNYMAMTGKPAISVSRKGVTITTMADKKLADHADPNSQPGARITLNEDGISIVVGGKAGFRITKDNKIQITDGKNKAQVTAAGWDFATNAQVKFSAGQKITLG